MPKKIFCRDCRYCGVLKQGMGAGGPFFYIDTDECMRFVDDPDPVRGYSFAQCRKVNAGFDCDKWEPILGWWKKRKLGDSYKKLPEIYKGK